MDPVSAIAGTVSLIQSAKEAYEIAQKLGNQDLRQKIADIREKGLEQQEELLQLRQQVIDLTTENGRLTTALDEQPNLKFGNKHLWEIKGEEIRGPFCVTCWETDHRKSSMIEGPKRIGIMCPKCKHPISGHIPPKEWPGKWIQ